MVAAGLRPPPPLSFLKVLGWPALGIPLWRNYPPCDTLKDSERLCCTWIANLVGGILADSLRAMVGEGDFREALKPAQDLVNRVHKHAQVFSTEVRMVDMMKCLQSLVLVFEAAMSTDARLRRSPSTLREAIDLARSLPPRRGPLALALVFGETGGFVLQRVNKLIGDNAKDTAGTKRLAGALEKVKAWLEAGNFETAVLADVLQTFASPVGSLGSGARESNHDVVISFFDHLSKLIRAGVVDTFAIADKELRGPFNLVLGAVVAIASEMRPQDVKGDASADSSLKLFDMALVPPKALATLEQALETWEVHVQTQWLELLSSAEMAATVSKSVASHFKEASVDLKLPEDFDHLYKEASGIQDTMVVVGQVLQACRSVLTGGIYKAYQDLLASWTSWHQVPSEARSELELPCLELVLQCARGMRSLQAWLPSVPELANASYLQVLVRSCFDSALGEILSQAVMSNVNGALEAARNGSSMILLSMQDADTVARLDDSGRLDEAVGMLLASSATGDATDGRSLKALEVATMETLDTCNGLLSATNVWPSLPAIAMAKQCVQILKQQEGSAIEEPFLGSGRRFRGGAPRVKRASPVPGLFGVIPLALPCPRRL